MKVKYISRKHRWFGN